MTSLLTQKKQIPANNGYYITVGDCTAKFYVNASGSDTAPVFNNALMASTMSTSGDYVYNSVQTAGAGVFRDHGKTLISSGRVFRKVQLMVSTVNTEGVAGLADGSTTIPGNSQPSGYLTGYIELPGTGGKSSGSSDFTPVARLG